jgi:probable HAF family extracellular repeat protein
MKLAQKASHRIVQAVVIAFIIELVGISARAQEFNFASIDVPGATGHTSARGINSSGNIVGWFQDATNQRHGFLLTGFPGSPIFQTIDFPANQAPGGVQSTIPRGISDAGDIVGLIIDGNGNGHGFLLTGFPGTPTYYLIDFPSAQSPTGQVLLTQAEAVNNNGDIVGAFLDSSGTFHGFKLTGFPGSPAFSIVDFPGSALTDAFGINDDGAIVGVYKSKALRSPVYEQSFLLVANTFSTLPATGQGLAFAINDSYEIVGAFTGGGGSAERGYLQVGTSFTVISFPHSKTTASFGIGPAGAIVGAYVSTDGVEHGFLATPNAP